MNVTLLLDMVAEGMPDRVLLGDRDGGLTAAHLKEGALRARDLIAASGTPSLLYLAGNGPSYPAALFGSAYAGIPFLPINYRLSSEQIGDIVKRHPESLVITDAPERINEIAGNPTMALADFADRVFGDTAPPAAAAEAPVDAGGDDVAVLLMTSGTTSAPKSAVLRHTNLTSYILGSVEFMGSDETDATILSVPPYHVAAVANLLSNLYSGRRIVYLDHFTPAQWLDQVDGQGVTHAMVVPTMLVRIVEELKARGGQAPAKLQSLSYGGAKIAQPALVEALGLFPHTGFVNAYGLTETASSIAVLGPEDHREALASADPEARKRLTSVGKPLPTVEIEIRNESGAAVGAGEVGEITVRGPQVAGEYLEGGSRLDADGWFPTRDLGYLDAGGYLFVNGRADDTIIRGGENIAPEEIEAVLADHPAVADNAVVGVPDDEWGHSIAAFVVVRSGFASGDDLSEDLRAFVRSRLRSSKTPDRIVMVDELPTTPTGKVLRRSLVKLVGVE